MLSARVTRDPFFTAFGLIDDLFGPVLGGGNGARRWVPALDVHATDDEYIVYVDLPGMKQDDIAVELEEGVLTISGTRGRPEVGEVERCERPYGQFVRTLTLPRGVDGEGITADYADGVLEVRIPKPVDLKPKKIAIGGGTQAALTS